MSDTADTSFREAFWAQPPAWPRGMELIRQEAVVLPQRGPGGQAVYDLAELRLPHAVIPLVLAYRARLVPANVVPLRARLLQLEETLFLRRSPSQALAPRRVPVLVTDAASSSVVAACEREDTCLLDQQGTVVLRAPGAFIRVQGTQVVKRRARVPIFHGKGARVVRTLLAQAGQPCTVVTLASATQTAYAYTHGVVTRLEEEGFVERAPGRSGFRVRDAVGLVRAWLDSGEPTHVVVEAFNAPSTTPETLGRGWNALAAEGIRSAFTLASGIKPEERVVSGLVHGLYSSGSLEPIARAFNLRAMTPHNFLVLRPEPAADTEAGGVYAHLQALPHGPAVALPQLVVDIQRLGGGRARDQVEALLERYARELPFVLP